MPACRTSWRSSLGPALETFPKLKAQHRPPFDLVFIDADKPSTAEYFAWSLEMSHVGTADHRRQRGAWRAGRRARKRRSERSRNAALPWTRWPVEPRVSATAVQTVGVKGYDGFLLAVVTSDAAVARRWRHERCPAWLCPWQVGQIGRGACLTSHSRRRPRTTSSLSPRISKSGPRFVAVDPAAVATHPNRQLLVGHRDLWCSLECTPACQAGGRGFKSRQVRSRVSVASCHVRRRRVLRVAVRCDGSSCGNMERSWQQGERSGSSVGRARA